MKDIPRVEYVSPKKGEDCYDYHGKVSYIRRQPRFGGAVLVSGRQVAPNKKIFIISKIYVTKISLRTYVK